MGEVYRARDTKLGREVAIKVLPEALAADPERIARFEREAKVLASLNHHNIAALFGMEEADGRHFLIMELVEGEMLAEKLEQVSRVNSQGSGLPLDEALTIALQIADALDAAHEKGIVHRDLKPANVMLTGGQTPSSKTYGGLTPLASERPTPVYASLDAPADHVLGEDDALASLPTRTPMVFTPDGRSLVIQAARAGKPQLFLRSLDRPDARPIAGTDDARVPFVSPDGQWVGFWSANEIRKVPIEAARRRPSAR